MGNQLKKLGIGFGDEAFEFDKWIKENGFQSIKQVLIKHNLTTLENLISVDHATFDSLLMSENKISQSRMLKVSLIAAIQKLKNCARTQQVVERINNDVYSTDSITYRLHKLYNDNIVEVEKMYNFQDFHSPALSRADIIAKPMVLLVGSYSTGKTSLIQYLIGRDFPGMRIGPEPTTDAFYAIMHGEEEKLIHGWPLTIDTDKPFQTLGKLGAGFLDKFYCSEVPATLLKSVTFIDGPGIISGAKRRLGRNYDYAKVMEWFAYRSDRILIVINAHRVEMSDEFKASLEMIRSDGLAHKIQIVLNKADILSNQQLLRVYGAVMWGLSKVFKKAVTFKVYIGSFWDQQYWNKHSSEVFDDATIDLIDDIRGLPRIAARRKLVEVQDRIRKLKVHSCIIDYLRKENKRKGKANLFNNMKSKFIQLASDENLDVHDFPNPNKFQVLVSKHDVSKYLRFTKGWRTKLDNVSRVEIPRLMKEIPVLRTELMVYGYIREMEVVLKMNIPMDIWIEITVFCE